MLGACERSQIEKLADRRSSRLLRRPPESPAPRAGRAARSRRCRVLARRPGRSADGGPPRRGARQIPRHRRRQEPARRHQARRQHPAHRGEEGQAPTTARRMPRSMRSTRRRRWPPRSIRSRRKPAPPSPRKISPRAMSAMAKLRPAVDAFFDKVKVNDDDARRARKPPEAAQRNPRRDARGGGFFQDLRTNNICSVRAVSAPEACSLAPLLRGEGWGEGRADRRVREWGKGRARPLTRIAARCDLSPRSGER